MNEVNRWESRNNITGHEFGEKGVKSESMAVLADKISRTAAKLGVGHR